MKHKNIWLYIVVILIQSTVVVMLLDVQNLYVRFISILATNLLALIIIRILKKRLN